MKSRNKNVVVTGASTGIGYSAVEAFLKAGCNVYGMVRSGKDANRLKDMLKGYFQNYLIPRILPDRMLDRAVGKIMKL